MAPETMAAARSRNDSSGRCVCSRPRSVESVDSACVRAWTVAARQQYVSKCGVLATSQARQSLAEGELLCCPFPSSAYPFASLTAAFRLLPHQHLACNHDFYLACNFPPATITAALPATLSADTMCHLAY